MEKNDPLQYETNLYMEICAAIMTQFGVTEVEIDLEDVPNKPFSLFRRHSDDGKSLIVRLVWGDKPSKASRQ